MIVCTMCGQHNGDDTAFCGDCGRFLEWSGERVKPAPAPVVVAEPVAAEPEPRPGWWRRLVNGLRSRFPSYRVTPREEPAAPEWATPPVTSAPADEPDADRPTTRVPPAADSAEEPRDPPPPPAKRTLPAPAGAKRLPAAKGAAAPPGAPTPPPADEPPAGATRRLPAAGGAKPPTAGGKLPAAGARKLPAAGGDKAPAAGGGGGKLPAAGTKKKLPTAGRKAAPELVAALVNPVEGSATNKLEDTPELPPQEPLQKTKPIVRTKPSRRLEPGDLVCGVCGEGNSPTRRFCSRCGESLDRAGVVRAVWWRRLFTWLFRSRRKAYAVGTRPGQKGTRQHRKWVFYSAFRKLRVVVALVAVIIALSYALYPPFRDSVRDNFNAVVDNVMPALKPVYPHRVEANVSDGDHTADKLSDTYRNTYWAARWATETIPRLTFTFESNVLLRSMILYSSDTEDFTSHGRPSIFRVTYSTGKVETLLPQDKAGEQVLTFKNNTLVDKVVLEIVDIYGGRADADVAISEIEFFALR